MKYKRGSVLERFNRYADKSGDCWIWTGYRIGHDRSRRASLKVNGKNAYASRISWGLFRGEIPEGICVCHHCDNVLCVNPSHLFLGTHSDNMQDMIRKGRSGRIKLNRDKVIKIREMYALGGMMQSELAELFNVGRATICFIVNRKNWKHI